MVVGSRRFRLAPLLQTPSPSSPLSTRVPKNPGLVVVITHGGLGCDPTLSSTKTLVSFRPNPNLMAESTPAKSDAGTPGPKYPAPKDKVCQYCGVAFTSSSLGRHLDQFIKDKKPKRPDDVHDVDEIRRLRGGITRRQPRNSLRAGRETLTPVSTPKLRDSSATHEGLRAKSPFSPKEKNDSVNGWEGRKPPDPKAQLVASCQKPNRCFFIPIRLQPLTLDFPALALRCLCAPPTLFSSTQYPSPTSWSIQAPAHREFEALGAYFRDEFKNWRVKCATATTILSEELKFATNSPPRDMKAEIKQAEERCNELESQIQDHLQSSFAVWERLSTQRQDELWHLEMARSVGSRHKELEVMREERQTMTQRIAHLEAQVEQLSRWQNPKEFNVMAPQTIPVDPLALNHLLEASISGAKGVGLKSDDRHVDLTTVVSRAIERWRHVIADTTGDSSMEDSDADGDADGDADIDNHIEDVDVDVDVDVDDADDADDVDVDDEGDGDGDADADDDGDEDGDAEMEDDVGFSMLQARQQLQQAQQQQQQQQQQQKTPGRAGPVEL
ncbi:unnamed protein product [Parascedosporium putredinis]|uniref:Uncharacterized protein n=1 Tax=Parascedosporium putredinis TaxID=1442378 RepID=A0A9P1MFB1_9PEZI|nr:unnamed protein product [Parascedosporium putredinis]CAI8004683.1 unnamed protein product [Parascedosporium putredinis]